MEFGWILCGLDPGGHNLSLPEVEFNGTATEVITRQQCVRSGCDVNVELRYSIPPQYSAFAQKLDEEGCFRWDDDNEIFLDDFERVFRFGENPVVMRSAIRQWFESPEWQMNRKLLLHLRRLAQRDK